MDGAVDDAAPPRPAKRPVPPEVVVVEAPAGALVDAPRPENRPGPLAVDVVGRLPNGALGALEAGWLAPALPNRFMALVEPCVACWRGRCCLLIALASSKTWTKSRCAEGELGPPETAPVNAPAYRLHALATVYQVCTRPPLVLARRARSTGVGLS